MQRIRIYENDNTNNSVVTGLSMGAVLIPGFANAADDPVPVGKLVECTSLKQFKANFGTSAPKFKENTNFYPYSGAPVPEGQVKTYKELLETYDLTATLFDATQKYAAKAQCIHGDSLYAAKAAIETEGPWDETLWNHLLTHNDEVEVLKDETRSDKTTYYRYKITRNVGSFTYIDLDDKHGFPARAIPTSSDYMDPNAVPMFINDCDPSWTMAYKLISVGMPVVYVRMNESTLPSDTENYDVTITRAYDFMHNHLFEADEYNEILDKNINIQFITSGGYPVLEHNYGIDQQMIAIASSKDTKVSPVTGFNGRGDCIAVLDHTNNPYRPLIGSESVFECNCVPESSYATVFTPWCKVNFTNLYEIPASFVYLYTLALKGATSNTWDILAGISKGRSNIIESLNTQDTLTNKIAEKYQNDYGLTTAEHCSINPITYIRSFGYCIWGDRTCEKYVSGNAGFATSFLHVRNLVCEVKKKVYLVSQELMFQTNDDILWTKFKTKVSGLLDQMVAGNGLTNYSFSRDTDTGDATLLSATLTLYPAYGLEKVEISINLENDTTLITEQELE